MIAINELRREPHYRREAFDTGLEACGYRLEQGGKPKSKDDLLVVWNRMSAHEPAIADWETRGGTVLVCENAYLQPAKFGMYAISVHGHCGSGWFPVGDEDRFSALGFAVEPWKSGGSILVCGQRGIGSRRMASPPHWDSRAVHHIKAMGHRGVRHRPHPGRVAPKATLDQDLSGAGVCVVWSSASGVLALTRGIPVVYCAPHWICSDAATHGLETLASPARDDGARKRALHRMSHGQWTVAEIQTGEPFKRILARLGEATW